MRRHDTTPAAVPTRVAPPSPRRPATGPPGNAAQILALQRTVGNAAVGRLITPVQRAVTVGGKAVDDPVALLATKQHDELLSGMGRTVLGWAARGQATLAATDVDDLVIQVERIAAMASLAGSILSSGILGRKTMSRSGTAFSGSNDRGDDTALAVNVLDNRSGAYDSDRLVHDSLTARDRGSFSVAMERPTDDDMVRDQLLEDRNRPRPDVPLSEPEQQEILKQSGGDPTMLRVLTERKLEEKFDRHGETLGLNRAVFNERVQNTIMAIMSRPGADVATRADGGGYESSVPADVIPPGPGGFTTLIFPKWFEPWAPLMLTGLTSDPTGLTIRFAGDRRVTAKYRALGEDHDVTVDAPDYASEVGEQLTRFGAIATHILKTAGAV
ncbi:hypothetical protein [Actinoplanes siamensis]|uniref:Uncharacterized protein n=1 Tax=Actinoplanes siamensis TaxID=1223317 RepID=A0A919ND68_9ACTN|nr:hypothetical protein [Actinoplanes siamensis]GIF08966.1 hypothetical protein Asi03nite_65040 [Actinoplanes siamensis]